MPEAFDPYLKSLAILPEEQPANHYRLLGVPLFLDNADVIENAADGRRALLGQTEARVSIYDLATGKVIHEMTPYVEMST